MRNYSYSVLFFVPLIVFFVLFFSQKSNAADGNQYRDPNMWQHTRTLNDDIKKSTVNVDAQRTYPVAVRDPATNTTTIANKIQKSSIKVPANALAVGKKILKGGAQIAIASAFLDIVGKAVDYAMDEENNRIKYKDDSLETSVKPHHQYVWVSVYSVITEAPTALGAAQKAVNESCRLNNYKNCQPPVMGAFAPSSNSTPWTAKYDGGTLSSRASRSLNPNYDPTAVPSAPDWQYIPIETVANKIISHADAGKAPAMEVMNNTALDLLEQGLLDAQLDAAAQPKEFAENESEPSPETTPDPDKQCPSGYKQQADGTCLKSESSDLPPFCSWATKVCDFIDWVKTEPPEPPEGGEVDVQIPDATMHEGILERLYINMPAQCPSDPVLEFMGARIPFPMSVFCQFAAMMKPLILLFAYIKGMSIVGSGLP